MFASIENRVQFLEYNRVVGVYENLTKISKIKW